MLNWINFQTRPLYEQAVVAQRVYCIQQPANKAAQVVLSTFKVTLEGHQELGKYDTIAEAKRAAEAHLVGWITQVEFNNLWQRIGSRTHCLWAGDWLYTIWHHHSGPFALSAETRDCKTLLDLLPDGETLEQAKIAAFIHALSI